MTASGRRDVQEHADRKKPRPVSIWQTVFGKRLPLERETALFIMASAMDTFMTYLILQYSAQKQTTAVLGEGNPFANFFISLWGVRGMVYFKFTLVAVVTVIAQIIARERIETARKLLNFATLIVGAVVIYSLILLLRHLTVL